MSLEEVHKVAQGRVWSRKDALELGLVDKLGGLAEAVLLAKQEAGLPQVTSLHLRCYCACSWQSSHDGIGIWDFHVFDKPMAGCGSLCM